MKAIDRTIQELCIAVLAVCGVSFEARAQCQYAITTIIEGPDCGIFGTALLYGTGLNDQGQVVGFWEHCLSLNTEAFYWSQETGMVTLERPPGVTSASASDISETGLIVGTYQRDFDCLCGFIYDMKSGQWTELPPNEGGVYSWANAISPDGSTVVGARTGALGGGSTSPYQAFVYDVASATFTDLGVMNGPSSSASDLAIAERALTVVGFTGSAYYTADARGCVHSNGRTTILEEIPGGQSSYAEDVNSAGTVLGGGRIQQQQTTLFRAFTYQSGQMKLLPLLPGHDDSRPGDIDDGGRAVGNCRMSSVPSSFRACLWDGESVHDLNDLVETELDVFLTGGISVTNVGPILCAGKYGGYNVAVLLSPESSPPADLNNDCVVGAPDLMLLLEHWGSVGGWTDLNGDGLVNATDLAVLLGEWGVP